MRPLRLLIFVLCSVSLAFSTPLLAAPTVDINGNSASYANLAGDYGPFTISAAGAGNARVDASDVSPDTLQFHNVVITADQDGASGHIIFYETFNAPPSGNVTYETAVSGTMKRGTYAAELSTFSYGAQIVHPTDNASYEQIGPAVYPDPDYFKQVPDLNGGNPTPASYGNLSYSRSETLNTANPRLMRGEFYFTLSKSGDKLTFPSGTGIIIKGSAQSGDRDRDGKECCKELCHMCKECGGRTDDKGICKELCLKCRDCRGDEK